MAPTAEGMRRSAKDGDVESLVMILACFTTPGSVFEFSLYVCTARSNIDFERKECTTERLLQSH